MISRICWHWVVLSYFFVGLVALLPRVLNLGGFVTHDEAEFWIDRAEIFLNALQSGNFAETAISTHPGVTTMWLGMIGIFLRRIIRAWGLVQEVQFPLLLALMRLPVALTHVVGVLVGYNLLRRMFPSTIALLAALLWALDPFVIGYSRLLHVDALMGTFITLSVLAACVYWNHEQRLCWLLLSGGCAGCAILSKSPALSIVPIVIFLAFSGIWKETDNLHEQESHGQKPQQTGTIRQLTRLGIWGIACLLTIVLLWPAVWAGPLRVYEALRVGVEVEGANPHMTGNFFLGHEDSAPGILFYPVTLALRTTPWTLLGLLSLSFRWQSVQAQNVRSFERKANKQAGKRVSEQAQWRDLAILAGFIILFMCAMSVFPKKFNRYLVPVFPALDILAAFGLVGIAQNIAKARDKMHETLWGTHALLPFIACVALLNVAWCHPYTIAYFNQILGGPQAGAQTFSVGWGEGLDQVAAWLNEQPDITGVVTAAIMIKSLNPYLRYGAQATTPQSNTKLPKKTGYVVVYIYQAQGTVFPPFDHFYPGAKPLHTVRLLGVDYAWIYQVPPPVAQVQEADFGDMFHLRGFAVEGEAQPGKRLTFQLFWQTRKNPSSDYWLFAHLIDVNHQRIVQIDVPYSTSTWNVDRYTTTEFALDIPAHIPAGPYRVYLGLYDPSTQQRLPLQNTLSTEPAVDGLHALMLTQVVVQP